MVKRNVCFYGYGNERFDVSFEKEWNVLIWRCVKASWKNERKSARSFSNLKKTM
jgi:hypothetical protein